MNKQIKKYDIVCGEGKHRSYTCCLAELILLSKYGNQPDYFWNGSHKKEYIKLIKLSGKIANQIGRERLAWFIYKNPDYKWDEDIGLLIWSLKKDKSKINFSLGDLVVVFKNKFRPKVGPKDLELPDVKAPIKNKSIIDFIGDI